MQSVQLRDNTLLVSSPTSESYLRSWLQDNTGLNGNEYYMISNGKLLKNDCIIDNCIVHIIPRLLGGKGGFGSMLRAIGAQIEKTTNREACRDLSGRRLRDINEEKRLKNWINQQVEREKETTERKKKKLEKLCEPPKHEFKDEEYQKERSVLPEIVEDAVTQGLQASCSTKRKSEDKKEFGKKKKTRLWIDLLDEELSSSDESEVTSETENKEENKSSRSSVDFKKGHIENVEEEGYVTSDKYKRNEEEDIEVEEKAQSSSSSNECETPKK